MKLPFKESVVAIMFATGLLAPRADSAAGLTATPSSTSNTYVGFITLSITGLTNHEPINVQTCLDGYNNGVVDPSDLLMDAFTVVESGVTTIGGVTITNVPFGLQSRWSRHQRQHWKVFVEGAARELRDAARVAGLLN